MGTHLVDHIDKRLGIVPRQVFDHLDLIMIRKYCRDQTCALVRDEGMADQPLPGCVFTVHEEAVKLTNILSSE